MSEIIASTYEVKKVIGAGGGGTVFLARHLRLNKDVVLKADKRKITTKEELLRREVNVLKDLHHAHVPQVYDFFIEDDTVYTVIDFVQGESLDKPLKRGEKFSQPQVIKWGRQLLDALAYLHSPTHGEPPRGYVHGDIKPANLMRTPNGDICLIDFNIALAIGEESFVGLSPGYASPEHYGLDYSAVGMESTLAAETNSHAPRSTISSANKVMDSSPMDETVVTDYASTVLDSQVADITETVVEKVQVDENVSGAEGADDEIRVRMGSIKIGRMSESGETGAKLRKIVPDVRSDIYSVGATLYHLLSGKRPAKDAKAVVPLSKDEFSSLVVDIITKAMNPNPDLRYQTAEEMLTALNGLYANDPRVRRLKKQNIVASSVLTVLFVIGVCASFTGLKRIQTSESWLKLVEYSKNALAAGDVSLAVDQALEAIPQKKSILTPSAPASAQEALAAALGVYDLSDGYKTYETIELPSEPLYIAVSPKGTSIACIYTSELAVFDALTGEKLVILPAVNSALAELEYLNEDTLVYAGREGITAYDLTERKVLWSGGPTTAVSVASDGKSVAAVYKDELLARVYDATDGAVTTVVDFGEGKQSVAANDVALNPEDNLFSLNGDGTLLATSFADGGLKVFDLKNRENDLIIYEESEFTHFEGGFFGDYFAFSATNADKSVFVVIDVPEARQTGGFSSTMPFHVQAGENGIYISNENILVGIDPESGDQEEVAYTDADITKFQKNGTYTIVSTADDSFSFFGSKAALLAKHTGEMRGDFVGLAGSVAVVGSVDSPTLRVLRLENHPDKQLLSYDPDYSHSEARLSADGRTVMLFRYDSFRLYGIDGEIIADMELPDAAQVYDQQYRRDTGGSWLEVIYNDGLVRNYSAEDGRLISETQGEAHDGTLYEEYETDKLRIEAPLHGTPIAYDLKSGKQVAVLESDDYLTYVTQVGDHIITEYMTAQGERYGLLLNEKCEILAKMPNLCDVFDDGTLLFDDMLGNLRKSRILTLSELINLARN